MGLKSAGSGYDNGKLSACNDISWDRGGCRKGNFEIFAPQPKKGLQDTRCLEAPGDFLERPLGEFGTRSRI